MIELKEDESILLAFNSSLSSESFEKWIMQYIDESALELIIQNLKVKGVEELIVLQDIEVPYEKKGNGTGTKLLKQFMQLHRDSPIVLVAEAFGSNLVNLESWYEKYGFETVGATQAGPLMLYKL